LKGTRTICVAVTLVAFVGCDSKGSSHDTATREVTRTRPQHLFTATIADPKTFNPIIVTDSASSIATGYLFDTLVRLNEVSTEVEPALAERWESNTEGTEWTFHLRHDVRWHDGVALTAADVVFTFDAIYDPRVPSSLAHILTIDDHRIEVDALDDFTVRFRLPRPFAPFLYSIGAPIVPKHCLGKALAEGRFAEKWGIGTPPDELVGSGPYRMVEYVPAQYIELRRNPDYWMRDASGAPLPYLEEQTLRIVPNQDTAYLKFLSGETDIHNPRPEEISDLRSRSKALNISVEEIGLDTGSLFVTFNRNPQHYNVNGTRDPRLRWFTDKRFLQAIAHSIDKESIISNCYQGYGQPAVGYISPENKRFYDPELQDYEYDLNEARRILTAAGYVDRDGDGVIEDPDGHRVEFNLNTNAGNQVREKICSILKEDWTKLGLRVNYRPLDFTLLVEKLDTTFDWDAVLMGFTGGIEPQNAASLLRSSGNLHLWYPNQSSPSTTWEAEIDRLVTEGSRELDPAERSKVYRKIQEILHRELPMIQTVREERFTAYKNTLENFRPTVWGVYRPELIRIQQ
jgi:peptide/nickel transport system substrate-binding protein